MIFKKVCLCSWLEPVWRSHYVTVQTIKFQQLALHIQLVTDLFDRALKLKCMYLPWTAFRWCRRWEFCRTGVAASQGKRQLCEGKCGLRPERHRTSSVIQVSVSSTVYAWRQHGPLWTNLSAYKLNLLGAECNCELFLYYIGWYAFLGKICLDQQDHMSVIFKADQKINLTSFCLSLPLLYLLAGLRLPWCSCREMITWIKMAVTFLVEHITFSNLTNQMKNGCCSQFC